MNNLSNILFRRLPRYHRSYCPVRRVGKVAQEDGKKINPRHFLLLVCPITAFSLGYWQIQRRKWKLDLLEKYFLPLLSPFQRSKHSSFNLVPSSVRASTDLPEFQPVVVEGRFDHSREMIIGPRAIITDDITAGGYGSAWGSKASSDDHAKVSNLSNFGAPAPRSSWVGFIACLCSKGHVSVFILVNRGWVPATLRDPAARPAGQVEGYVKLTGCIRYNEKPPPFTPGPKSITNAGKNQQPHQQYFCREVDRMSQAMNTLPLFIDAFYGALDHLFNRLIESSVKGGPIGGQTKVLLRNNHLEYIITWFSLGTFSLAMWVYWLFF
ncbi:unnamed protein product [Mesocestoides corti]|uniref:SURF1-like protein n=1 Tax=Mesocestoides corti TaxID=53468 RepID=A0A0R3U517_MESCO|nr:unnamed protein product [Mesocestoides corti]